MSGSHHFYENLPKYKDGKVIECVNALCRAHIISTLPLQNLSIYAAFRACFCTYFSELSDYWVQ